MALPRGAIGLSAVCIVIFPDHTHFLYTIKWYRFRKSTWFLLNQRTLPTNVPPDGHVFLKHVPIIGRISSKIRT